MYPQTIVSLRYNYYDNNNYYNDYDNNNYY